MKTNSSVSTKSIFDLTPAEMEIRLTPALIRLKEELYAKGLPLTYQDDRCPTEDHCIQEYEDGTCFLALFTEETKEFVAIGKLPKPWKSPDQYPANLSV